MHLLDSIPVVEAKKIEEKINTGAMSLTTVAMVQDLVRHKKIEKTPMSVSEKLEVLQSIEGLSKRETEKVLISKAPEMVVAKEKERVLTAELTEIKIVLDEKTLAKLKRIKALRSHVNANPSYSELIDDMADLLLKKLDPLRKPQELTESYGGSECQDGSRRSRTLARQGRLAPVDSVTTGARRRESFRPKAAQGSASVVDAVIDGGHLLGSLGKLRSRHIPTKYRQRIWQENQGRCSYQNPQTGKACGATHSLQIDHIIPFAKNGATTPENLTLLCANHNRMRAREEFNRI